MVILYAKDFEVGQIIQIDTSLKQDYLNTIPFNYGVVLYDQFNGNQIVIGVKFHDNDCFVKNYCVGEPLDIQGRAKIRLYKSSFNDQSYSNNDYIEKLVDIKHGILQLSDEELEHFITILDVENLGAMVNHKNKKELKILDESGINDELIQLKVSDLDIQDITLLSVDEAGEIPMEYRKFWDSWWLRSPGSDQDCAAVVGHSCFINHTGYNINYCGIFVRPVLLISNLQHQSPHPYIFSAIKLDNDTRWIVISDNMLLCDDRSFGQHEFDTESNDYETSEIKQYIHEKAKELGFKNIGGATNVNHKNKKKLVVLDENIINKNMDIWYNNDFDESYDVEENYTIADDFDYNYIKLK